MKNQSIGAIIQCPMVSNDKMVGGQSSSLLESCACIDNFLGIGWGVQILSEKALYFIHIVFSSCECTIKIFIIQ